jgi:ubiquinol-cytochrome c reductase cytochrome c1 subunit
MKIAYKKALMSLAALSCMGWTSLFAASSEMLPAKNMVWPFSGPLGTFDRQAAQRGFQVYKEVCATCHSLKLVSYRSLADLGFTEAEIKTIAAEYSVKDGPNDAGEMFERPARPSDRFVGPHPNEQAARAANNGAYPADLSLIVKARHDGANYIYSLLTGYDQTPPEQLKLSDGMNYNPYFPGMQIAMPKPLSADQVTYSDGTAATIEQMSKDVTIFLQWAAEPEMEARKRMGLKVMIYLAIFTFIFYVSMKRMWRRIRS